MRLGHMTAREHLADGAVEVLRDRARPVRAGIRAERVLLAEDPNADGVLLLIHRSPPTWVCWRRKWTRSSIWRARALAAASRSRRTAFSRSTLASRSSRSKA